MQPFQLVIEGMSCAHCVRAVTGALSGMEGVRVDRVSIGSATGEFDPTQTSPAQIADAVQKTGYAATPVGATT